MPTQMRLWRVEQEKPRPVQQQKLDLEARIENWIRDDVGLINDNLLVIGQQVPTEYGGFIDLLAIDPVGNLVILELKRDKTPRDIVAQALDYASWVEKLGHDDIRSIANAFLSPRTLEQAFRDRFQTDLPEVLNERHRMYVVASSLDSATERIVKYLSESHKVDINAATFAYFRTADGEFLGRSLLLDDEQVVVRAESTSKRQGPRTWDEFEDLASQNGVRELFDRAVSELGALCDGSNRTRSNIALVGIMGEEEARNTLMGIYPGESSKAKGLIIMFHMSRVCEYFHVQEAALRGVVGSVVEATTYNPETTFAFDDARLESLIRLLSKK